MRVGNGRLQLFGAVVKEAAGPWLMAWCSLQIFSERDISTRFRLNQRDARRFPRSLARSFCGPGSSSVPREALKRMLGALTMLPLSSKNWSKLQNPADIESYFEGATGKPGEECSIEKSSLKPEVFALFVARSGTGIPLETGFLTNPSAARRTRLRAAKCASTSFFLMRLMAAPGGSVACLNGSRLERSPEG